MRIALLVCFVMVASAAPARAQEQGVVLATEFEQRLAELAQWLNDYERWEKWFELWGNRVAHNFDDQPLWERMKRPAPPAWLAAECRNDLIADGLFASACSIVRQWDEQPLLIVQRRGSSLVTSAAKVEEKVAKSSFLRRVHLTGLWTEARYPGTSAYGIVGLQVGVFEAGRLTLPAVGVMLMMVGDRDGGYSWRPATTLGFGYRICDFVPPLIKAQASLHFNIARTQIHGAHDRMLPGTVNVNLFGLSVSATRRR